MAKTTIHSDYIPDNAITSTKIAENSIGAREIATNAITTLYVADGSVTTVKIADDAITSAKLDTNIDIAGTFDVTGATTLDAGLTVDTTTLVVDASNNRVGIGTSSPSQLLSLEASDSTVRFMEIKNSAGSMLVGINGSGNALVSGQTSSKDLIFELNNDEKMRIHNSGKLGIGTDTTTPTGKVTIAYPSGNNAPNTITAANTYVQLGSTDYGPNNDGKFMIGFGYTDGVANTHSPAYIGYEETSTSGDTKGNLTFYTRNVITDTAPTNRMTIDTSGNVGIGDTSPQDYLEINGSGKGLGGLTISNDTHNHAALSFARSSTATARIYINEPAATHTSQFNFQTSNASGGGANLVTAMVIDENQNVGIGTTDPGYPLEVASTATTSIAYQRTGVSAKKWGFDSDNSATYLINLTDNVRAITAYNAGNIGIGTINPAEKLHVEGSVLIDAFNVGDEEGIFFREGFSNSNKYNVSIMAKDHNGNAADGLSINGYDGISFCTGSNSRNEVVRITGGSSGVGKILIGDTASHTDDLLQIETPASGGGHGIQIRRNDSNSDQGIGHIQFGNNTDTDLAKIAAITDGDTDCARLVFSTQPSSGSLTERMRIHATGQVTIPYQPAFRVYLSTEQTSNGVITTGFTDSNSTASRAYDENGDFNTSNGRFTAPVAGVYVFSVMWDSMTSQAGFDFLINGTEHVRWEPTGLSNDGWESKHYSTQAKLQANDYVQLKVVHASGSYPVHQGSGIWGHWAGALIS